MLPTITHVYDLTTEKSSRHLTIDLKTDISRTTNNTHLNNYVKRIQYTLKCKIR